MPMQAKVTILKRSSVTPEEFNTLAKLLKGQQLDIKMKKGAVAYKLGTLTSIVEGRDALMAEAVFNPGIKLVTEGEGEEIKPLFVEWITRGI